MFKMPTGVPALVVVGLACLACTDGSGLKSRGGIGGQTTPGSGSGGTGGQGDCICDFVPGGTTGSAGATGSPGGRTGTTISEGGGSTTATSQGTTGSIGGTDGGGATGTTGGLTSSTGGSGGSPGTGGNKCTTDQNTCATDDDCTIGDYRPPILSPADCYCFVCGFPVAKTTADDCQAAYVQFCGPGWNWQEDHNCPAPGCPAFQARCVAGVCQLF
jgi:hypothetical protein